MVSKGPKRPALNKRTAQLEKKLLSLQDQLRRNAQEQRRLEAIWQDLEEVASVNDAQKHAKRIVKQKNFKKHLCPALQTVSNDSFEIAKAMTPILVGLVVAGTVAIPLTPVLFASLAIVVSRMSIAAICADYPSKEKK